MGILDELEKRKTIILKEPLVKRIGSHSHQEDLRSFAAEIDKLIQGELCPSLTQMARDIIIVMDVLREEGKWAYVDELDGVIKKWIK